MTKREIRLVVDEVDVYNMKQALGEEIKILNKTIEEWNVSTNHNALANLINAVHAHRDSCFDLLRQLERQEEHVRLEVCDQVDINLEHSLQ